MRTVSVSDLKAKLSAYLRGVKQGNEVLVLERGKAIARLVPVDANGDDDAERAELIRQGLLRPARGPLPSRFWKKEPRAKDPHGDVLRALLDERASGR